MPLKSFRSFTPSLRFTELNRPEEIADRRPERGLVEHKHKTGGRNCYGRLTSRRQCPKCGTIYNLLHQPPKKPGVCDNDNTPLVTRKDDQEDVVKERLKNYIALSRPVLAHYQDAHYHEIRGDRSAGYVFEAITGILEPLVSKNGGAPPKRYLSHSGPAAD